jgi:hypothetical protein
MRACWLLIGSPAGFLFLFFRTPQIKEIKFEGIGYVLVAPSPFNYKFLVNTDLSNVQKKMKCFLHI